MPSYTGLNRRNEIATDFESVRLKMTIVDGRHNPDKVLSGNQILNLNLLNTNCNPLRKKLVKLNPENKKRFIRSNSGEQTNNKSKTKGGGHTSSDLTKHFYTINFCNTRSIFNKLNLITIFLQTNNVDLIFFTETWLSKKFSDQGW